VELSFSKQKLKQKCLIISLHRLDQHINTLFKVVQTTVFNASVQALSVLWRICQIKSNYLDRFYQTLYATLFDRRLWLSSKKMLFLNILYKALREDHSMTRIKAFVKRLLQV
jgi:ribosome biogenesis protein MAK21